MFQAAHSGTGLTVTGEPVNGPYTPAVTRSLAIAALAALGAGGDDARANTEYLATESGSEFCLNMSKLMLFQCLAASRPSYEDMFCVGRHIARDLATCTSQNLTPGGVTIPTTVQDPPTDATAPSPTPVA